MDWFKHDINAHEDIKIRKLKRMHGMAAYGVYWELVELMYSNGGTLPGDSILDEVMLMGIEEDDARDMCETFLDLGLFRTEETDVHTYVWTSERVESEIAAANTIRQRMSELGKRSGAARQRAVNEPLTSRKRAVNAPLNERRGDKNNTNNTVSSPLQEESLSSSVKSKTDKTHSIITSELQNQELAGGKSSEDPAFIFLPTNKGEEYPITESKIKTWEEAYPAVDVKSQLREMKAWCMSNPKNRKTSAGMDRFCNTWLSRQQDKARRIPQHNQEVIRGTNIGMTLVADGTRPDQEYQEVKFE